MKMRTYVMIAAFLMLGISATRADWGELSRQALEDIRGEVQASIQAAGLPKGKPVAVLPIQGDSDRYGIVAGLLQTALTGAGLDCVLGKDDPLVDEIAREFSWNESMGGLGILDPATTNRFGRLRAGQMLLYGTVRENRESDGKAFVYLELHILSIETKQHLWGGTFARRRSDPLRVQGVVDLGVEAREALRKTVDAAAASLQASGRLGEGKTVAVIPFAGDLDLYVTGLAQDLLSRSKVIPKRLDTPTLADARRLLKDAPGDAQALMHGALRDLSERVTHDGFLWKQYELVSEIQMYIQSVADDSILWSATEVQRSVRSEMHPNAVLYGAGAILLLFVLLSLRKAMTRVR